MFMYELSYALVDDGFVQLAEWLRSEDSRAIDQIAHRVRPHKRLEHCPRALPVPNVESHRNDERAFIILRLQVDTVIDSQRINAKWLKILKYI